MEQPGTSDDGQSLALRKMVELIVLKILEQPTVWKKIETMVFKKLETMVMTIVGPVVQPMVISTVRQEIVPAAEGLLRKVVKDEIQKLLPGETRNEVPKERNLHLKFLDEVLGPVQTRKELRGINNYPLQVALLDETGQIVTCGPESRATVEIVLTDTSGKDDEHNTAHENFERRVIKTGDKEKPHFAKSVYIDLKRGIGSLIDIKLGQPSDWTKNCECSLGVRLVHKFTGITVHEAWTAPFKVKDNRGELYKNHDRPSLHSEVWRLKGIGRGGKPLERLEGEKIMTVQDLLFWLSVNPKRLQKLLIPIGAGDCKWNTIVEHARTCNIDDKRIFFHKSSADPQSGVIYDVVGELKGVIDESNFVPIDNLSADKKDCAHKLLTSVLERSAFGERYKTSFEDEASLLQEFPYRLMSASTNSSMQLLSNGCVLTLSENISGYQSIIVPNNIDDSGPSDPHGSRNTNGDNPTDLDYGKQCFSTSYKSMEILEADPREMLASCNNWESVNSLYDMNMNHLQQHSTGVVTCMDSSLYPNCGTSEVVGDPSSISSHAPFDSGFTRTNSFGDMEIVNDPYIQYCSSELFVGLEQEYCQWMKQYGEYVEPNTSKVSHSWKQLLCILRCWFSISKRVATRKRKRCDS